MKMTFYGQFVAGEDQEAIKPLLRRNQAFGVGAVLDYSVEEDLRERRDGRWQLRGRLLCHQADSTGQTSVPGAVLGGAGEVAEVLSPNGCRAGPGWAGSAGDETGGGEAAGNTGQPQHCDQGREPGVVHGREPGHKQTGQLEPLLSRFSEEEDLQMKRVLQRMDVLAKRAMEKGVRLMVDAEQSYFQPAISRLTVETQRRFNRNQAIIFNTYQCYLREAYDNVTGDMELSRREGWHFGTKLVRGAYMEQERERAAQLGYEDPINPTYEKTNEMYHRCLDYVLEEIKHRRKASVMVASHNEDTVKFTLRRMMELGIHPSEKKVCFGQLLGMCDQITFPLASIPLGQAGFPVYKYVPYGPVNEVLPYLSRRAQENRGFMQRANRERDLLWKEVKRRLLAGNLFSH
ncbi:proline dehydrogenase 1, mitochondrial isoform X5 [Pseudopipra pipra]|uniref:proline dehydrogenase 1, mitochondrial isoform X5 n=1 Tax=Pseudopipra pipra TaxID=415032 RepID=UPI0031399830